MSEITTLKREAAKLYVAIFRRSDDLSCGAHLADFIRPDLRRMQTRFDCIIMARLREIDPEFPQ